MRYYLISAGPLRKNHPQIQNFTENFSVEPVRQALKKRKIISTYDPGKKSLPAEQNSLLKKIQNHPVREWDTVSFQQGTHKKLSAY